MAAVEFRLGWLLFVCLLHIFIIGPVQVPLIEDLEQILMRSWRESHLSEIRQYQQPQPPTTHGRHYGIEVRRMFTYQNNSIRQSHI